MVLTRTRKKNEFFRYLRLALQAGVMKVQYKNDRYLSNPQLFFQTQITQGGNMRSRWSDRLFGKKGKNKQPGPVANVAPVEPVEVAPQPPETHEFLQQIHGSLSFAQYQHFPAFSDKQVANFIRKYQASARDIHSLQIVSGDHCDNLPITSDTTCEDVFKALSVNHPASHFVVQLGDLLFRLDEASCDKRRWLEAVNSHSTTIIVCQKNQNTLQEPGLAALHATGFANPFITNDEIIKNAKNYHVIFLNSPENCDAQSLVKTFSADAKMNAEGWLSGTVPHLDGATFWAPSSEANTPESWIALARKLNGPVRIMVCVSMESSRFVNAANGSFFQKVNRAFLLPATARIDIVFTDCEYRGTHVMSNIKAYGYGSAAAVCEWLPGVQCAYQWATTTDHYERLTKAEREIANIGVNALLKSIRTYHGVPLNLVINDIKPNISDRIICQTTTEENLVKIAKIIARALDTELMLRAVKILHGDGSAPFEEKFKADLKKLLDYLDKVNINWFFDVGRTYLENAVHRLRLVNPANSSQAVASTAPRPRR